MDTLNKDTAEYTRLLFKLDGKARYVLPPAEVDNAMRAPLVMIAYCANDTIASVGDQTIVVGRTKIKELLDASIRGDFDTIVEYRQELRKLRSLSFTTATSTHVLIPLTDFEYLASDAGALIYRLMQEPDVCLEPHNGGWACLKYRGYIHE